MKNVLIINGHQFYEGAQGKLTQSYINKADVFLKNNGFEVKHSVVDKEYDVKEELEKFVWADYILLQYPVYWMSLPWVTKKYVDEIFTGGMQTVTYYNDGRSRDDANKKYGSGGLMKDKKYMLSITYNCPISEFDNKEGFFEGLSLDEANYAVHKVFQFCGVQKLETYSAHDIFKGDFNFDTEIQKFEKTLAKNFL